MLTLEYLLGVDPGLSICGKVMLLPLIEGSSFGVMAQVRAIWGEEEEEDCRWYVDAVSLGNTPMLSCCLGTLERHIMLFAC